MTERMPGKQNKKAVTAVATGVATVSCAVTIAAFGAQAGTEAFNPDDFLNDVAGTQTGSVFNAAYNVDVSGQDGKANMQSDLQQNQQQQQPSLEQVNAADFTRGEGVGSAALVITDGEADMSVVAGTSGGVGEANPSGAVAGPIVNGGEGGQPDPDSPPPGGDEGEDGPIGGVDDPAIDDPDPTTPTLPDPFFGDDDPYFDASEGVKPASPGAEPVVTTDFSDDDDYARSITPLYRNEVLTKAKLMCAGFYYATIDNTTYRLTELGRNFEVVSYAYDDGKTIAGLPATISASADALTVNFRIRANADSQWHDASITLDVYAYKVLLEDYDGAVIDVSSVWAYQYPNYSNDSFALSSAYAALQPEADEAGLLHQLFLGWSETGQAGTSVGGTYAPEKYGLTILKPVPLTFVPSDMKVGYSTELPDDPHGDESQVITLFDAPTTGDVIVPEGVAKLDSAWKPESLGTLTLPSTLTDLGDNSDGVEASVADAFAVAEGNPFFSSANGLLVSLDVDQSGDARKRARVPSKMTEVVIPADVSEIAFADDNAITSFATEGDDPLITCKNGLLIQQQEDMFGNPSPIAIVGGGMTRITVPADAADIQVPQSNQLAWIDVEEGNIGGYTSENGMMVYAEEGWGPFPDTKAITLIPSRMKVVTLPAGITDIAVPENGSITWYANGDGVQPGIDAYWASDGALCGTAVEEVWGEFVDVDSILDVPSSLTRLVVPANVSVIAEGAVHEDNSLVEYVVEEGNETFSSKNGLLVSEDMFGYVMAAVPSKMAHVIIPVGVDELDIPENNCIESFEAEEGATLRVENGMVIEDRWVVDEMGEGGMQPVIAKIPARMTRVVIPADVAAIADDAIPAENAIEWFDVEEGGVMTTSNGMVTSITYEEEEPMFPWEEPMVIEVTTIAKIPSQMTTVTIASDVSHIADGLLSGSNAITVFVVEDEYGAFSVRDGLLYETQDWGSTYAIIGIPVDRERVTIPAYIEGWDPAPISSVSIPVANSIKTLAYEGVRVIESGMETDELIAPDFTNLHAGATVVVPDADFSACYAVWSAMLSEGGIALVSDAGQSSNDFIVKDGALLSADGKVLMQIQDTNAGVYVVPDGVVAVAGGATATCPNVTAVVLPASVTSLGTGALTGDSIQRVLFMGADAPTASPAAVGDDTSLQVASDNVSAYQDAFGESAANVLANDFTLSDEGGFGVLRDGLADARDNQVIVLSGPDGLSTFDESSVAGATAINANAFANNASLRIVNLPESLKSVGANAFSGCSGLELFCSLATDTITMEDGALTGCDSVNGMAFNAASATLDDSTNAVSFKLLNTQRSALCPKGATGYADRSFKPYSSSYRLDDRGSATLLLGVDGCDLSVFGCNNSAAGTVSLSPAVTRIHHRAFFGTNVTALEVSSATPPALVRSGATSFQFVENTRPSFRISLVEAARGLEESYIEAWKASVRNISRLRDDVAAQNEVRALLGMDSLPQYARTSDGVTLDANGTILEGILTTVEPNGALALAQGITTIGLGDEGHIVNASCPSLTLIMPTTVTAISAHALASGAYNTYVFTSAAAPTIQPTSLGITQQDAPTMDDAPIIMLAGAAASNPDSYVQTWKAAVYEARTGNEYTDAVSSEAEGYVRELLGLPAQAAAPLEAASASEDAPSALAEAEDDAVSAPNAAGGNAGATETANGIEDAGALPDQDREDPSTASVARPPSPEEGGAHAQEAIGAEPGGKGMGEDAPLQPAAVKPEEAESGRTAG